jgi:hypothetical protein
VRGVSDSEGLTKFVGQLVSNLCAHRPIEAQSNECHWLAWHQKLDTILTFSCLSGPHSSLEVLGQADESTTRNAVTAFSNHATHYTFTSCCHVGSSK